MTSYTSNIWKYFIKNNQTTLYANEHIKYNIPSHAESSNEHDNDMICPFSDESIFYFMTDMMLGITIFIFMFTKITRLL